MERRKNKSFLNIRKIFLLIFIAYLLSIIFLIFGSVFTFDFSKKKLISTNKNLISVDFIALYGGGKLAKTDRHNLYNFEVQKNNRVKLYSVNKENSLKGELPFVYPPLVAWFFSFFSYFEFYNSFYLWTLFSLFLSLSSLFALSYYVGILTKKSFLFIIIAIFGFLPYSVHCLANGQVSTFGIMIYSLIFILLKEKKDFLAGLVLSLGYYKPPIFLFFSIVFIFQRGRHFFYGCVLGATVLSTLTIFYVGFEGFRGYLTVASKYTYGQKLIEDIMLPPEFGAGIFGLISNVFSSVFFSYLVIILLYVVFWGMAWTLLKGSKEEKNFFDWFYSFVAISSISLSFQINNYDLSILLPFFIIIYSKIKYFRKTEILILSIVISFYFEWLFRKILIYGSMVNLSSFLLIMLLLSLFLKIKSKQF